MKYVSNMLFNKFQDSFPFSCVDLIVIKNNQFLLVRRTIPPYRNRLCLPGGIIRRNEKLISAIKRIGKNELGVEIKMIKAVGFYEKIYKNRHDISHCFIVRIEKGIIKSDHQASEVKFFNKIPKETADFFKIMLQDAGFS
jgi:ADP-ribose pyrophosphatase YjhB (NUDIX family)